MSIKNPKTPIEKMCNELLKQVFNTGCITEENAEKAIVVLREEVQQFFEGENYNYKEARESLELNNGAANYVFPLLVTNCVERINNYNNQ